MTKFSPIPYGKQHITEDDISAVISVLKSDYLTQGPAVAQFEKEFADYIGAKYAIAVANGTAALHLSILALGVSAGDKVITTPITFSATANCIRYAGAEVVFADIDSKTWLLDGNKVRALLENDTDRQIKGIIPVDFAGLPVQMDAFRALADEFGLWILEDSCHAPGGFFLDANKEVQKCGNGSYADLAIFSFHPVKHIATGEGGMITTNDKALYEKLLLLRTHGITRDRNLFQNSLDIAHGDNVSADTVNPELEFPGWYMELQELGFNYRLSDIQAALGSSQLKRASTGLKRRKELAIRYHKAFSDTPKVLQLPEYDEGHAWHLYPIMVENRRQLYDYLRQKQIFTQIHYVPLHLMPYYQQFGWKRGEFTVAEHYYNHCLSLPMYPSLTNEEQDFVISSVIEGLACND